MRLPRLRRVRFGYLRDWDYGKGYKARGERRRDGMARIEGSRRRVMRLLTTKSLSDVIKGEGVEKLVGLCKWA